MKAMVFAAGKRARAQPITNDMPEPMIPLVREPVFESIVDYTKLTGVARHLEHLAGDHDLLIQPTRQADVMAGRTL